MDMSEQPWSPASLLQLSGGYWSACALHAGVKLNVFTPLEQRPMTSDDLGALLGIDPRALGMLLDALAAMHLLNKHGTSYTNAAFSTEYLSKNSLKYLGYIILHHHHLMQSWSQLETSVRSGKTVVERISHCLNETERESFLMGMFNLAMQLAPIVVPLINLSSSRRLLDLGGGPGTYAIHFCQHYPKLMATVYDLETTKSFAEKTISRFGLADRIDFKSGDYLNDEIDGSYDVAWISHVLHGESETGCMSILAKAVAVLEPGGELFVQEFVLDDTKDGPLFPALFSLNMLLRTEGGKAYSQSELVSMMQSVGLMDVRRIRVDLPNGAGIICGRVSEART